MLPTHLELLPRDFALSTEELLPLLRREHALVLEGRLELLLRQLPFAATALVEQEARGLDAQAAGVLSARTRLRGESERATDGRSAHAKGSER
jgi:hypothetical protein